MSKKIVAIGGGENGRKKPDGTRYPYELDRQDKEIVRLTGKEHPNFLLLAHAQPLERQDEYFRVMIDIYGKMYGCHCKDLKSNQLSDKEYVKDLIDWADIIFEGGGNTLEMIKLWVETGFDTILRQAWEDGKVMCGVSAGANCWFKECFSDSLKLKYGDKQPFIAVNGLGFVDGLFNPHCDKNGRLENVKQILKTSSQVGLSVSCCAALEIVDTQYRLITSVGSEAYALKSYWKNGDYIEETIDASLEFKPLEDLLTKN